MRIGHGFDIHRFIEEKPLMLAGIEVPHIYGLQAHSDGDVIIHAVCDACLGAAALGDIGQYFPDTDAKFDSADSRQFLTAVLELLAKRGYRIVNVDITVMAEHPKLAPIMRELRESLAGLMQCDVDCVSIKATTMEKLGPIGAGEAMAAEAVVLIDNASK